MRVLSFLTSEYNSITIDTLNRVGLFLCLIGSTFRHEWTVYCRRSAHWGQRSTNSAVSSCFLCWWDCMGDEPWMGLCSSVLCSLSSQGIATALRALTVYSHLVLLFFLSLTKSFEFLQLLHHKLLFQGLILVINLFTTLAFKIAASADRFCSWDNNSVDNISIFYSLVIALASLWLLWICQSRSLILKSVENFSISKC